MSTFRALLARFGGAPRSRFAIGLAGLGVLVILAFLLAPRGVEADAAARRDVVETLAMNARVFSRTKAEIESPVVATVAEVPAKEGEGVRKGQLLVRLEDREETAALEQARQAEAQAAAKLLDISRSRAPVAVETRRQAEIALEQSQQDFTRLSALHAEGFLSESEMENARRARETASSRRVSARLQEAALAPWGSEERAARAALAEAAASRSAAEARLARRHVTAPSDGVVLSRLADPGDVAQLGKTLIVFAPKEPTLLLVQPDEKNLASLRVGQPALASADAFPGRSFPARVTWVAPGVDEARGTVDVRLLVENPPGYLKTDMTLSVEIETARRSGVLTVPTASVRDAARAPWVLVARDGRAVRQAVTLGARGERFVEVLSGLAGGEPVIRPSSKARSGDRVQARISPGA